MEAAKRDQAFIRKVEWKDGKPVSKCETNTTSFPEVLSSTSMWQMRSVFLTQISVELYFRPERLVLCCKAR